jgi:hypothetical protein
MERVRFLMKWVPKLLERTEAATYTPSQVSWYPDQDPTLLLTEQTPRLLFRS